ncbi:MAG: hypothetical protein KIT34_13925 [Cyanobacteria bacterium TGS_CYA1]|nr:hypothetical protein [Cyanobacteria bacterium TGS_CYA1]MDX2107090.1 hypothetical protein [Candidatus Melainabacteria bacterium]
MLEKQASSTDNFGTLVLSTGLISPQQMEEAKKTSKNLNVPLERSLVMLDMMSGFLLGLVQEANELVSNGTVSLDLAVRALRLARQHNMKLKDAIGVLGQVHKKTGRVQTITTPVTELLLASNMITMEQIGRAVSQAQDSGMQTGRILVLNRDVSSWMMTAVLNALLMVRDGKIDKENAKEAISTVGNRRVSIEQALFELGLYVEKEGNTVRIGELVAMAGFVSESDMLECLEIELVKEKQFGQILLEQGLVTSELLEAAIILQDMVASGNIKAFQAAEALRAVRDKGVMVYQAMAELKPPPQAPQKHISPQDLLVEAGFLDRETINQLVSEEETSSIRVGKKVLTAGIISEAFLYLALRTYSLFRQGFLSADQATKALALCKSDNMSLDEVLSKQGWFVPARMQWIWS